MKTHAEILIDNTLQIRQDKLLFVNNKLKNIFLKKKILKLNSLVMT